MDIDLKDLSATISDKLGREFKFVAIEKIGSGYHSDGYKLKDESGSLYFLKQVKSHDLGFEFPERKIFSLLVSNAMGKKIKDNPQTIAVIVEDGKKIVLPDIREDSKIYHLQEFGGEAKSYSAILEENLNKKNLDKEDERQIVEIAKKLLAVHSIKHPSNETEILRAVYNDSLRSVLTHPELSIMLLTDFPNDYPVLNLDQQKELIALMFENIKKLGNREGRLSALHGDFWGANIFFREDGSVYFIDFSRMPWGDPGIDVGWFLAEYLWYYHTTGNQYFKDLANLWLKTYEELSGDQEIKKTAILPLGFIGIVRVTPRFFPNLDQEAGTRFINHIFKILKEGEFVWND